MLAARPCLFLLLLACPLLAQDPQVHVSPGLAGYSRVQRWFPVQVEVVGTGEDFVGVLSLETRGTDRSRNSTRLPVLVPRGARKRYELQHRVAGSGSTWLTLHDAGGRLVYEEELVNTTSSNAWAVGVFAPNALGLDEFRGDAGRDLDAVVLRADDLPSQPWGLDALDWLIWDEPDPQAILPQQVEAVRDWVLSGGRLVLCVARNADLVAKSPLSEVVPGRLSSPKGVKRLVALAEMFRGRVPEGEDTLVAQIDAEGEVLAAQEGLPLIVRSRMGLGEVILLTFDPMQPAIVRWGQREEMWKKLLRLHPTDGTSLQSRERLLLTPCQGLVQRMESAPLGKLVNGALFIYLFAFYVLAVGVADYVFWKLKRRPFGIWLTTPLWIAAFSVVAWWIGVQGRREADLLRSVAVYDRTEDGKEWSLWGCASLYVGSGEKLTLRPAMDRGVLWPEWGPDVQGGIPHESLTMTQVDRGLEARDVKMYSASMLSFVYRGMGKVPEMDGFQVTRDGKDVLIDNNTQIHGLTGYVLCGGHALEVGPETFEPGMRLRIHLNACLQWRKVTDGAGSAAGLLSLAAEGFSYDPIMYQYRAYNPVEEFGPEAPRYLLSLLLDPLRQPPNWKDRPSEFVSEDPNDACLLLTGPNGPTGLAIDPSHGERVGVTVIRIWLRNR